MIIHCFGARGSIPVCGKEFFKYGGNTTCIEIRTKNDDVVIIDAGTGIKNLGDKLLNENCQNFNLIFTHVHWDHILGLPFFRPLYNSNAKIEIYGCPFLQRSIKEMISITMADPYFPIEFKDIRSKMSFHHFCESEFLINTLIVKPIFLSHPNKGVGYKFIEDDKSFVFLTDNELGFKHPGGLEYDDYLDVSSGADLLIHDAELTKNEYIKAKKWGHSDYNDALRLALEAEVYKLGLFHHNQERTDLAIDNIVVDCQNVINNKKSNLNCFAVYEGMEINL